VAVKLTEKTIKDLAHPTKNQLIIWDSEVQGFGIRITTGGVKSFVFDYRIAGRQRRYTIGRHPELSVIAARGRAVGLRMALLDGRDPMAERQQRLLEPTVEQLGAEYLIRHALPNKRASSVRDDKQMISKNVNPALGKLRVKSVTTSDVQALHLSLKSTPYKANRVLSLLSKMFSFAMKWKLATENPALGIQRFQEAKRERFLTAAEMQALQMALDSYADQNAANALRLLMLTGSREGEVLKAEWEQFDLRNPASPIWTKPSPNTKQKKEERLPISREAYALLLSMKPSTGPLFSGAKGRTRVSLRRPWMQACRAAGFVEVISVTKDAVSKPRYRTTLRIHDLRHNYASHLVTNGESLYVVGKLLGHTQASTTMRYAHLQDEKLRAATNVFGSIYSGPQLVKKAS
jgi:integrase